MELQHFAGGFFVPVDQEIAPFGTAIADDAKLRARHADVTRPEKRQ
jgi:hypothetical protein